MALLYGWVQDQMVLGFTRLLASIEDTCLDFPDAAHSLSLFLGRAVIDEALQPTFLTSVLPSLKNDSLGVAVVRAVSVMLGARHGAERLLNCWHGGARSTAALRDSMAQFLAECEPILFLLHVYEGGWAGADRHLQSG